MNNVRTVFYPNKVKVGTHRNAVVDNGSGIEPVLSRSKSVCRANDLRKNSPRNKRCQRERSYVLLYILVPLRSLRTLSKYE